LFHGQELSLETEPYVKMSTKLVCIRMHYGVWMVS